MHIVDLSRPCDVLGQGATIRLANFRSLANRDIYVQGGAFY
jgi:hypothetical protein